MKKRIIFFDGDGTLWYPKKTKNKKNPGWVYNLPENAKDPNKHLILTPTTFSTIKKLKKKNIITIILSTNPHPPKKAEVIMKEKIKYFKLESLFDEIYATPDKGKNRLKALWILKILKKRKIPKKYALMVGDSYRWDCKPTKNIGVDSLLIKSEYMQKTYPNTKRIKRTIKKLKEVLDYI